MHIYANSDFSGKLIIIKLDNSCNNQVAESEIQSLTEMMSGEKTRNLELEKELMDLKSSCTCSGKSSVEGTLSKEDTNFGSGIELEANKTREIVEVC